MTSEGHLLQVSHHVASWDKSMKQGPQLLVTMIELSAVNNSSEISLCQCIWHASLCHMTLTQKLAIIHYQSWGSLFGGKSRITAYHKKLWTSSNLYSFFSLVLTVLIVKTCCVMKIWILLTEVSVYQVSTFHERLSGGSKSNYMT